MKLPKSVNIVGIEYRIMYMDKPSDVDMFGRESLWGNIDYWTRTIRVYNNNTPTADVWETILHEVMHGIAQQLKLQSFDSADDRKHDDLDVMALALMDVFVRNGWMVIEEESSDK